MPANMRASVTGRVSTATVSAARASRPRQPTALEAASPHPALPPAPRRVSTATVSAARGSRPRQPTALDAAPRPALPRRRVESVRRPSAQRQGADRASPRQPRQHANPFAQPGLASGTTSTQYGDRQRSVREPTAPAHGTPARQPICAAWPRLRHHVESVRRPSAQREGADRASPRQPRQHANPFAQPGLASGTTSTQYGDRQRSEREPTAPTHGRPASTPTPFAHPGLTPGATSGQYGDHQRSGREPTAPAHGSPASTPTHLRSLASPPARRRVSTATISAARGSRPRQPTAAPPARQPIAQPGLASGTTSSQYGDRQRSEREPTAPAHGSRGGITPPGCEAPAPSA